MPSPYNDVELTDDDKQAIYENPGIKEDQSPKEAGVDGVPTVESQSDETESPEASNAKGANEASESDVFNIDDYKVEIDGETFDGADIKKWREDSQNKENWQASNTQKSQDIAKWSKFTEKVTSDGEFKEYIKDYFYDDNKSLKSLGLDDDLKPIEFEEEATPPAEVEQQPPLNEIEERLNKIEIEKAVDNLELELDEIVKQNENIFRDEKDELDFLEFVEDSKTTDLESAFKIWAYDKMQSELDHHRKLDGNKQRNQGKVVHNSELGATETAPPKVYKNVKDIDIEDPDIAKYFNR